MYLYKWKIALFFIVSVNVIYDILVYVLMSHILEKLLSPCMLTSLYLLKICIYIDKVALPQGVTLCLTYADDEAMILRHV